MSKYTFAGLAESDGEMFPAIPAGRYPVRISSVEPKDSKNGNPMLVIRGTVIAPSDHENTSLTNWLLLPNPEKQEEEEVKRRIAELKNICIAADIDVTDDEFEPSDLHGCELTFVVDREEKEGEKPRNNVKSVLPLQV